MASYLVGQRIHHIIISHNTIHKNIGIKEEELNILVIGANFTNSIIRTFKNITMNTKVVADTSSKVVFITSNPSKH